MNHDDLTGADPAEQWSTLTKFWTDFATKVARAGLDNGGGPSPPPEVARKMRDAMFDVMSQYMDDYLRSPQFLEANKQSMDAALTWRTQVNDMLSSVHHEMQGMAKEDLDTVLRSVGHLENRMLSRMEQLETQLAAITAQLASMKNGKESVRETSKAARRERGGSQKSSGPGRKDQDG